MWINFVDSSAVFLTSCKISTVWTRDFLHHHVVYSFIIKGHRFEFTFQEYLVLFCFKQHEVCGSLFHCSIIYRVVWLESWSYCCRFIRILWVWSTFRLKTLHCLVQWTINRFSDTVSFTYNNKCSVKIQMIKLDSPERNLT